MIYLTGDTHIPIDISKLNTTNFPEQREMTREDCVIVLGDFGLLWHDDKEYRHWLKWLCEKSFTILWLDGNHENHEWIQSLPAQKWHGGDAHFISDNIIHLMRGQIYDLQGKSFFVMGGAMSTDKARRRAGISWWEQEVPSVSEGMRALDYLHHYLLSRKTIDYVLTHTCPKSIIHKMFPDADCIDDPTTKLLDAINQEVEDTMQGWYFGHWHEDKTYWKYHCLYDKIERIL